MVLSSQQPRSYSGRSYMYARRGADRRPWLIGSCLVAGLAAAWFFWPGGEPAESDAVERLATAADPTLEPTSRSGAAGHDSRPLQADHLPASQRSSILPIEDAPPPIETASEPDAPVITMGRPENASTSPATALPEVERRPDPVETAPPSTTVGIQRDDPTVAASPRVAQLMAQAESYARQNDLVRARDTYNIALHDRQVGAAAEEIRRRMAGINDVLVFSATTVNGDPFASAYVVKSGDLLVNIARRAQVDWRFIARINGIKDPSKLRVGQTIKVVNGPFHAVVDKSDFRLDLYLGEPDADGRRTYIRSFPVGLGEYDSTPVGAWVVRSNSKLINPAWANPRTGERFAADDPRNPIGEHWIGLDGIDDHTRLMDGYGIHGTVEPESIGRQASMGCIRMHADDVALVYELLLEGVSSVHIHN